MPDPSAFAPVTDALGAHAGKLIALSGAGGLLGGYLSSQEKGNPHETPADRRKRILKNALGYALATGGIGATGLGAASLLSSTEGTEGGVSPWKNTLGRLGLAAPMAALAKYTVGTKLRNGIAGQTALSEAAKQLGNPLVLNDKGKNVPLTGSTIKAMPTSEIRALAMNKGITTQAAQLELHDLLRRGNAGHTSFTDLANPSSKGAPWVSPAPLNRKAMIGAAVRRNKLPLGIGAGFAMAPEILNTAGTMLGWTAKD